MEQENEWLKVRQREREVIVMAGNTATIMLKVKTDRSLRLSLGTLVLLGEMMDLIPDWHVEEKEKVRRRGELLTSEIKAELTVQRQHE